MDKMSITLPPSTSYSKREMDKTNRQTENKTKHTHTPPHTHKIAIIHDHFCERKTKELRE